MEKIKIKQVDAFTSIPHTGNPAGVVVDGKDLSEKQMQAIAREMNASETAFVLPPAKTGADIRIRCFSPANEVLPCGHSTLAGFHALAEEGKNGMSKKGKFEFKLETHWGGTSVEVTKNDHSSSVMFGVKIPLYEKVTHYKVDLVRSLDISQGEFENRFPITRSDYLFVPVKRLHTLFTMKPNFLQMANLLGQRNLQGMCVFTTETVDRESTVHSRFFAPHNGINEDPVTGLMQGQLGVYLFDNGFLDITDGRSVFQAEQGDAMGRPGRVTIELNIDDHKPTSVKVGGNAVTVMDGTMVIHE